MRLCIREVHPGCKFGPHWHASICPFRLTEFILQCPLYSFIISMALPMCRTNVDPFLLVGHYRIFYFLSNCNPAVDFDQMRSPWLKCCLLYRVYQHFWIVKNVDIVAKSPTIHSCLHSKVQFYLQYNTIIYQVQNLPNRFYKPSKLTGWWTSRILHGCFAQLFAFYILLSPQTLLYWNKCLLHKTINYVIFFFNFF